MLKDFRTPDDVAENREMDQSKDATRSKFSPKGIRTMQGAPEPTEAVPPGVPPETRGHTEQIGFDATHERARLAAEQALADKGVTGGRLLDARRHASEAAARATLAGDASNLDDAAKNLGMKGNNFPTYDIASSNQVASVKTHWADDGVLNDAVRQAYQQDLEHMLGWGRDAQASKRDGQNIIRAREAGVPVPDDLRTATPEQAAQYLRDKSILAIPDDHVETVRADLKARVLEFPGNYFLPSNPSEAQVEDVLKRVRGLGLSSGELRDMIAKLEE